MPEPVGAFHHPTTITDDEKLQQWPEKHNREMMFPKSPEPTVPNQTAPRLPDAPQENQPKEE
ncbi:hypothetical protein N7537_007434 [Penicillium hordei]|uniref:Uncharacterized protein n=1 Tax=Penicillium hordei TaxID=40994 RepID=A0AAD6GXG9_9EURO|nr:uncharacterized protein N7537_007434 [Penicillium hordei]KAJ5597350.1 hypothetical protein N7537_007434 [Penicillium hordei]